jgi:hypothetical protein
MRSAMLLRSPRLLFEAVLFLFALGLGAAALSSVDEAIADALYFCAWYAAMLLIFTLGLRLPLYLQGHLAFAAGPGIVAAALTLALLGNIALYRHDAHFDATINERFTPPPELETIARSLQHDVVLTYFYNNKDDNAYAAEQVLAVVGRQRPRLKVRALDLDTELTAARNYGVKCTTLRSSRRKAAARRSRTR